MLPPWRKRRFCRFSLIRGLGNAVFRVFRSSEASEMQFFAFSARPRPRKCSFSHFPLIRGLGNAVFRIFRSSEASDGQKNREIWHWPHDGKTENPGRRRGVIYHVPPQRGVHCESIGVIVCFLCDCGT